MSLAKARVRKPAAIPLKAGVDYKVVTLRLDPAIWASFREIANDNGQSIVGRLRTMVRRDVEAAAQARVGSA